MSKLSMDELTNINELDSEKFVGLAEKIDELAAEIDRKTKRGSCGKWMYYDPSVQRMVVRSLLFSEGKIFEEVSPGLYYICTDLYQTSEDKT